MSTQRARRVWRLREHGRHVDFDYASPLHACPNEPVQQDEHIVGTGRLIQPSAKSDQRSGSSGVGWTSGRFVVVFLANTAVVPSANPSFHSAFFMRSRASLSGKPGS